VRIVIAGAGLGGLRTAEALRAGGFAGEIVLFGREDRMPYTRPPLSKAQLAAGPDFAAVAFRQRDGLDLDWRLGTGVRSADLAAREVRADDGAIVTYDGLVAATGVAARRLPLDLPGRHTVRTFDDCVRLAGELRPGRRVLVLGAGFIGCEVAATATERGCVVTVVALDPAPMAVPLGTLVGNAVRARHEARGVTFRLGRTVTGTAGNAVVLDDGTEVGYDVLVEAVGSRPCTEWLDGNGLDLGDGARCDNDLRVRPGVVAVGDVARFPNPLFDDVPRRVEHWQMPGETARRAAATLLADLTGAAAPPTPFRPLPSFWSDQFHLRLQSFGLPGIGQDAALLDGDLTGDTAVGYYRDGVLVGVVVLGMPKQAIRWRKAMLDGLQALVPPSTSSVAPVM
jgi:3-phenylpropionate/trans-cinnamate dioxygenase ferredoxin reductase component